MRPYLLIKTELNSRKGRLVSELELTKKEQEMMDGKESVAAKKAMEILVALGKIFNAKRMVNINSTQISGVSYKNLGDAGVEFLKEFSESGAKVKIPATLNPSGMDLKSWREMGISEKFAKKQNELIKIFEKMGVTASCTCTPYLIGNVPKFQEHISWSESSAVSYANSVLGARTNRESGISALCSAITGVTPEYGYHLDENRTANFLVNVKTKLEKDSDFSALGYIVGKKVKNGVPYFRGIKNASLENLKFLGAAMAASGAVALYYVEGITPEAKKKNMLDENFEEIVIENLDEGYNALNSEVNEIDLVAIGCPHASFEELEQIEKILKGKKVKTKLWIMTSRKIKEIAEKKGLLQKIETSGARVFADTCMVVSPIEGLGFKTVATNSGKAAFYLPSYCGMKVRFGSLEKCINSAVTGKWN